MSNDEKLKLIVDERQRISYDLRINNIPIRTESSFYYPIEAIDKAINCEYPQRTGLKTFGNISELYEFKLKEVVQYARAEIIDQIREALGEYDIDQMYTFLTKLSEGK